MYMSDNATVIGYLIQGNCLLGSIDSADKISIYYNGSLNTLHASRYLNLEVSIPKQILPCVSFSTSGYGLPNYLLVVNTYVIKR